MKSLNTPLLSRLETNKTILLTDTACLFCVKWFRWIVSKDKYRRILFAPIHLFFSDPKTIVVIAEGKVYTHGHAIIKLLKTLPYPWKVLGYFFSFFPSFFFDFLYKVIAVNRYRISQFCRKSNYSTYQDRLLSSEEIKALKPLLKMVSSS